MGVAVCPGESEAAVGWWDSDAHLPACISPSEHPCPDSVVGVESYSGSSVQAGLSAFHVPLPTSPCPP